MDDYLKIVYDDLKVRGRLGSPSAWSTVIWVRIVIEAVYWCSISFLLMVIAGSQRSLSAITLPIILIFLSFVTFKAALLQRTHIGIILFRAIALIPLWGAFISWANELGRKS